jgi:ribonuclease-3
LGSNERLEYLGDAVIGLVVSEHLYQKFPDAPEGILTAMRAALVKAQTLGRVARTLGLGDLLYLSRGEAEAGGRTRRRLLAQAFEALVGAIYLDQGLPVTRAFALRLLEPEVERFEREQPLTDAKSYLQQLTQATTGARPVYHVVATSGPGHRPHFVVEVRLDERILGTGEGDKKQEAEQAAARHALQNWPSVSQS